VVHHVQRVADPSKSIVREGIKQHVFLHIGMSAQPGPKSHTNRLVCWMGLLVTGMRSRTVTSGEGLGGDGFRVSFGLVKEIVAGVRLSGRPG
jgi:hypothetical protein